MSIDVLTFTSGLTPLDLLLYRTYGRQVPGLVEQVLEQNPGLAALGAFPPAGTTVKVTTPPPAQTAAAATTATAIKLYD